MTDDNMNHRVDALGESIENTINHFRREWDISLAEVIGTLCCIGVFMMVEAYNESDGEDESNE
jgi:putative Mn2+ efflux pump MntP